MIVESRPESESGRATRKDDQGDEASEDALLLEFGTSAESKVHLAQKKTLVGREMR